MSFPDVTCIFIYQNVVFSLIFVDFIVVLLAYPVNQYSYLLLICIEYVDCGLGAISCVDLSVDRSNAFLWHFSMADRSRFGNDMLSLEIYVSRGYPLGSLTYVFIAYPRGFLGESALRIFTGMCVMVCVSPSLGVGD